MIEGKEENSPTDRFPRIDPPPGGHFRLVSAAFALRKEGARVFLEPDTSNRNFVIWMTVAAIVALMVFSGGGYVIHTSIQIENKPLGISLLGIGSVLALLAMGVVLVADRKQRAARGPLIIQDEEKKMYYFPWVELSEPIDSVVSIRHVTGYFRMGEPRRFEAVDQLYYELVTDDRTSFRCFLMGCAVNRKRLDSTLREGFSLPLRIHRLSENEAVSISSHSNIR